ncbi:MAG: trehalose-phosphatase [Myxococcaceae bacterium]
MPTLRDDAAPALPPGLPVQGAHGICRAEWVVVITMGENDKRVGATRTSSRCSTSAKTKRASISRWSVGLRAARDFADALDRATRSPTLVLLLDYDGTLVPLVRRPELAAPDAELKALLTSLSRCPGTEVHLVSGRMRSQIESWFGDLPIGLHSDHGYWSRTSADAEWRRGVEVSLSFLDLVRPILERHTRELSGTFVEAKSASLAWHYRGVDGGESRAPLLIDELQRALAQSPAEVLLGSKVVEVRPRGVSKALVARQVLHGSGVLALAMGDDRTDEDLFRALPADALTFHVGDGESAARLRLRDSREARAFLSQLAARRGRDF